MIRTTLQHSPGSKTARSARRLGIPLALTLLVLAQLLAPAPPASAGTDGIAERVNGSPGLIGKWNGPRKWPVVGIHSALLPSGDVLFFSYDGYFLGIEAAVWNPETDRFTRVDWKPNLFCGGTSFLPDGSFYVTGGQQQKNCEIEGIKDTHVFDPWEHVWTRLDNMRVPRYYPTNLTLGTGQVLILSGANAQCLPTQTVEIYTPGKKIARAKGANKPLDLYPRVHLLPDGQVAHVGPEDRTSLFSPGGGWKAVANTILGKFRYDGMSWLIPGNPYEVMICGGFAELNQVPTDTCERINFQRNPPIWKPAASMHFPRGYGDAVLLPDGRVLVVGGAQAEFYDDAIRNAEIYDPSRDEWTLVPAETYNRGYHSTALLLPNGQVISAGSDDHEDDHEGHNHGPGSAQWAELYSPPYMFRGPAPQFRRKMESVAYYGEKLLFRASQSSRIIAVSLMRPGAVTHSLNTEQRLIRLKFENTKRNKFEAVIPDNPNLLPPGYYMLFLLNNKGIPSKARWVQVMHPEREPGGKK